MSLRPGLPRSIPARDANTVCLQCWCKLARTLPLPSRPQAFFSTITERRAGAVVGGDGTGKRGNGSNRTPLSKDYFSKGYFSKGYFRKNSLLKETFWQSRRGLWSEIAGGKVGMERERHGNMERDGSTREVLTEGGLPLRGVVTDGNTQEVLPHRRRKKAKEEAAAQSQSPSPEAVEAYPIPLDASARLAELASNQRSLKRLFFTYLSLSKPRLSFLVVLTATATYSLYPVPQLLSTAATATPSLSALTLLFLTTGTALCSASANAFNMLMEPKFDAQMSRTRNRPLVRKLISTRGATVFAIVCGIVGTAGLYYGVNPPPTFQKGEGCKERERKRDFD